MYLKQHYTSKINTRMNKNIRGRCQQRTEGKRESTDRERETLTERKSTEREHGQREGAQTERGSTDRETQRGRQTLRDTERKRAQTERGRLQCCIESNGRSCSTDEDWCVDKNALRTAQRTLRRAAPRPRSMASPTIQTTPPASLSHHDERQLHPQQRQIEGEIHQ